MVLGLQVGRLDITGGRERNEPNTASHAYPLAFSEVVLDYSLLHILYAELVELTAMMIRLFGGAGRATLPVYLEHGQT